jgi:hypothetical protein
MSTRSAGRGQREAHYDDSYDHSSGTRQGTIAPSRHMDLPRVRVDWLMVPPSRRQDSARVPCFVSSDCPAALRSCRCELNTRLERVTLGQRIIGDVTPRPTMATAAGTFAIVGWTARPHRLPGRPEDIGNPLILNSGNPGGPASACLPSAERALGCGGVGNPLGINSRGRESTSKTDWTGRPAQDHCASPGTPAGQTKTHLQGGGRWFETTSAHEQLPLVKPLIVEPDPFGVGLRP